MHRFTAEFGMGSGGSNALWSSRNSGTDSRPVGLASANWVCDSRVFCEQLELSVRFVFTHRNLVLLSKHADCLGVIWSSLTGN